MASSFSSRDANGVLVSHYFRLAEHGLMPDNPELLAQGREGENSRRKRDYNRLPCFDNIREAKRAYEAGQIPASYGDWFTWRYHINAEQDAWRADRRSAA